MENCYPVFRKANKRVGCSGSDWIIKERVGEESVHAKVYGACCKEDCDYVMKVETADTAEENNMHFTAAELGIAPKIVDSFTCGDKSFIVMEALNQTAFDLILQYKDPRVHLLVVKSCLKLLKYMHSLGYAHGDSHLNNFMVKYETKNLALSLDEKTILESYLRLDPKYYLIDFGYSGNIDDSRSPREDYIKLFLHLNNHYESTLKDDELSSYAPILEYIMVKISRLK